MKKTAHSSAGALLAVALAACGPAEPGTPEPGPGAFGHQRAAIIHGVFDQGDPAVVAFGYVSKVAAPGEVFMMCTGTLIGPRTVLTAAHCVYPHRNPDGTPDLSYEYRVLFTNVARGTDAANGWPYDCEPPSCHWVEVKSQHAHPDFANDKQGIRNDIAVLELEEPVVGIGPLEPNPAPIVENDLGRPIRHVGFGQTVAGDDGTTGVKTNAAYPVSGIYADRIASGSDNAQTCFGDSGGPSLLVTAGSRVERVAGVVSYGEVTCSSSGVDTRVDAFLPWVKSTITWEKPPTCEADGACQPGCAPRDPDCAGTLEACTADKQCESQTCWGDPQHADGYCTVTCGSDGECPSGAVCASGRCEKPQRPEVEYGATCDPQRDFCKGFYVCSGPADEPPRCQMPCQPSFDGPATCPYANQECTQGSNGAFCKDPPAIVMPAAGLAEGKAVARCGATDGAASGALGLLGLAALLATRRRATR